MAAYLDIAIQLGVILSLLGILWNCVQMVFGTMEQRKFLVDTITKWFLFILCLVIYPSVSRGLRNFSIQMADYVSGANMDTIANDFGEYMNMLQENLDKKITDEAAFVEKLIKAQEKSPYTEKEWENYNQYNMADYMNYNIGVVLHSEEKRLQELEQTKASIGTDNPKGVARTINALRSVLYVDKTSIASKYKLDLSMKDGNGNHTGYISPNAVLRMSLLAAQIMWQKTWEGDVMGAWEENAKKGIIQTKQIIDFPFNKIFDIILCFFTMIIVVVVTCFQLIQYVMCIIEFIVCVTFGVVLIPCLLFDGLKDMAAKLIPTLISQAVKLAMITICMYFCCYTYLDMTKSIIADTAQFNIWSFAYVFFTVVITFALCTNAPKLASALLTGQPQMSMGEFVQAAGAIAGGTMMAAKAVPKAVEASKVGVGKAARGTANALGDAFAMIGGAKAGAENAAAKGGGKFAMVDGAIGGAIKAGVKRTGRKIMGGMQNAANYKGKHAGGGGGMGSGGAGNNRYGSNDPKAVAHMNEQELEQKREEAGFDRQKAENNTMDYGSHKTETGAKSTLAEYLKAQYHTGEASVKKEGTGSGNSGTEGGPVPPMPPSVPPTYGSNVSFSGGGMRNVTPRPEGLPSPGLPEPENRNRISWDKGSATDV